MAEEYAIVYLYHIFFTHFSADGNLGCSHALALVTMPQWTSGCMYPSEIRFSLGVGIGVRVQPPRGPTEQEQPGVDRGHQCVQLRSAQQEHGCTGSPAQDPEGRAPTSEQPAGPAPKSRKLWGWREPWRRSPRRWRTPWLPVPRRRPRVPRRPNPQQCWRRLPRVPLSPRREPRVVESKAAKGMKVTSKIKQEVGAEEESLFLKYFA